MLDNILKKYKIDKEKLVQYGFLEDDNVFTYTKNINDTLYAKFMIDKDKFDVNVYEIEDDTLYLPFKVKNNIGTYVASVREKVDGEVQKIIKDCFLDEDLKDKVFQYIFRVYGIKESYLWEDDQVTCVFKNSKDKWFAIYMEIPYKKLGIDIDDIAKIINLKGKPLDIDELIDNNNYFRAYHMNKKHWFTILLDNKANIEDICKLVKDSYDLVI